ncbi:hypothetical protein MJI69_31075, partial [Salmonella enterica subsp. enterica serovar Anatum]|nr:hypothetical protein [Salmonella enterica subsp. enterica serovar Anatum]
TLQGWQQDERLMLVIEDDGSGLPPGSHQQGFGLTGMRERVSAPIGGRVSHIRCYRHLSVCFRYRTAASSPRMFWRC